MILRYDFTSYLPLIYSIRCTAARGRGAVQVGRSGTHAVGERGDNRTGYDLAIHCIGHGEAASVAASVCDGDCRCLSQEKTVSGFLVSCWLGCVRVSDLNVETYSYTVSLVGTMYCYPTIHNTI